MHRESMADNQTQEAGKASFEEYLAILKNYRTAQKTLNGLSSGSPEDKTNAKGLIRKLFAENNPSIPKGGIKRYNSTEWYEEQAAEIISDARKGAYDYLSTNRDALLSQIPTNTLESKLDSVQAFGMAEGVKNAEIHNTLADIHMRYKLFEKLNNYEGTDSKGEPEKMTEDQYDAQITRIALDRAKKDVEHRASEMHLDEETTKELIKTKQTDIIKYLSQGHAQVRNYGEALMLEAKAQREMGFEEAAKHGYTKDMFVANNMRYLVDRDTEKALDVYKSMAPEPEKKK